MSLFHKFLDLIYPPKCPLCDAFVTELDAICETCEGSLHIIDADANFPHLNKIWFTKCRSRFALDGPIRDVLHGFKYGERLDLTRFLAGELLKDPLSPCGRGLGRGENVTLPLTSSHQGREDILLPVPLHVRRLRERGFNQSALIVRELGKKTKVPYELNALQRIRDIEPQVGLERSERLANIKDAFAVDPKMAKKISGKNIILIDDVITTGATVNECSRVLIKSGASSVSVLSIARTL